MTNPIALVDDEPQLRALVAGHLRAHGLTSTEFGDAEQLLAQWVPERFSILVLDIVLPGMDGLTLARRLREQGERAPILMLTARSDETDVVIGFEIGADDYLAKPFRPRELVARVRALLRRATSPVNVNRVRGWRFGEWRLDAISRQLHDYAGTMVSLSRAEYRLLTELVQAPGHVFTRDDISVRVFGHDARALDRGVDLLVSKLRRKLRDDAREPVLLKTVRAEGYLLAVPVQADTAGS